MDDAKATYPPLNTMKRVTGNLWIVDGPTIRFGRFGLSMPFPTRMTVVRLPGDGLFIHSPTALAPALAAEIERVGSPRWIIGPNRIHYWWIPEWRTAFPEAGIYLAPRITEQAPDRIDFVHTPLADESGYPWDGHIATLPVRGSYMTEIVFFHYASRSLILTDLIENFERRKLGSWFMRWLTRIGGAQDPNGQMPRDMRLTFGKHKAELRQSIERMIAWNPERVILAHGRWYEKNGADELRRAFRWILE